MTHAARQALREEIADHQPGDSSEADALTVIRDFVRDESAWFDRTRADGHLTASAVIVDPVGRAVLLIRHRKLGRWLQPGGHGEADELDPSEVARREAEEETGLSLTRWPAAPALFDVDVHPIPARPARPGKSAEPAHRHLDMRYAFISANPGDRLKPQESEVLAAAWYPVDEPFPDEDETMARLRRKVLARLGET